LHSEEEDIGAKRKPLKKKRLKLALHFVFAFCEGQKLKGFSKKVRRKLILLIEFLKKFKECVCASKYCLIES
jgi:hypothetical protein